MVYPFRITMPAKKKNRLKRQQSPRVNLLLARKLLLRNRSRRHLPPPLTPDLVMQMMAQMQEMSQELGKLREEVANVKTPPAAAEIDEYLPMRFWKIHSRLTSWRKWKRNSTILWKPEAFLIQIPPK
ncbi:MAG: hypothetical protein R2688_06540 [Fimbriimonadaceae bacterium]